MARLFSLTLLLALLPTALLAERAIVGGPTHPNGTEVVCDLPEEKHLRNTGGSDGPRGPGSGSGLCVWTSIEHSGEFQNVDEVRGLQKKMTFEPGGGHHDKVIVMMKRYCPGALYLQYEGRDPAILDLAIKTGRMPAVTYGYSERVGRMYHMVSLIHLDSNLAAVLDNNFPKTVEWMSRSEFIRRWTMNGGGWTVVLLGNPPSPIPVN